MNNYEIKIEGMHCTGCSNLISMELEDAQLENVTVDLENKKATFTSNGDIEDIKVVVKKVFENEDIKKYKVVSIEQA